LALEKRLPNPKFQAIPNPSHDFQMEEELARERAESKYTKVLILILILILTMREQSLNTQRWLSKSLSKFPKFLKFLKLPKFLKLHMFPNPKYVYKGGF